MQPAYNLSTLQDYRASSPEIQGRVLAVDDERSALLVLEKLLEDQGHHVMTVRSGEEALATLREHHDAFEVILLDRVMPGMDGLQVVAEIKRDPLLANLPIIMQTGSGSAAEIREGVEAGVFYYLVKPLDRELLTSVVESALREARQRRSLTQEMEHHRSSFGLMDVSKFNVRTLPEAEGLASFLALCYPDPPRVLTGIAELIINAVEHGNLGITYEDKSRFIQERRWRQEVIRRSELPEHAHKTVEVIFKRKTDGIYLQITDEGEGFNWQRYLQIDPSRATDNHGRGIAQANMLSFDRLHYTNPGNQAIAVVYNSRPEEEELAW